MLTDNGQIRELVRQGYTVEEAAQAFGVDPDVARLMINSGRKVESIAEMIEQFKPKAVRCLMEIAEFGENESARVNAIKILMTGEGVIPEASSSMLTKRLENMKRAYCERDNIQPVIELVPAN